MSKRIFKYPLSRNGFVVLPVGAKVLSAKTQHDDICIWAEIDDEVVELEKREFYVYGTGHKMHSKETRFIDTVMMAGGSLVFHVYEVL